MKIALAQLCTSNDLDKNLSTLLKYILSAKNRGCTLIAFPENCLYMGDSKFIKSIAQQILEKKILDKVSEAARKNHISVLLGGVPECTHEKKVFNTSYFLSASGKSNTQYRKIHLFNIKLASGEVYSESLFFKPGKSLKTVRIDTKYQLGMSICYDLRFPEQYRKLRKMGAHILAVPSAFTYETGKAHWHTLLRARAIENHAFVIAPAQTGTHQNGRKTYGHSLVIDPWGRILLDAKTGTGLHCLDINVSEADRIYRQFNHH